MPSCKLWSQFQLGIHFGDDVQHLSCWNLGVYHAVLMDWFREVFIVFIGKLGFYTWMCL